MFVAGIVFSAVAMFLGLTTKLPQGGGGLTSNLMALTFFLPAPPLPPLSLHNRILFDLETAIAENQLYYLSNAVVTRNGTFGPLPSPLRKLSASPTDNATFKFPSFDPSAFSLPRELSEFWESIGTAIAVFMALCLPCLVAKRMNVLGKTGPALQMTSRPTMARFGGLSALIEPPNPLLEYFQIIISERDQAFANVWIVIRQAWAAEKEAKEKEARKEEEIEPLCAERNKALRELGEEKEKVEKVEGEKKEEVDGLRSEISRQVKAWAEEVERLEEEKKKEVDELQEEALGQTKFWTEKEKNWKEEQADEKQRHNEALDAVKMGRERESESWRKQVEDLEGEQNGAKEAFGAYKKRMAERMEKEKGEWEKKRIEAENSWAAASDRAQRRIAALEAENQSLKDSEAKSQKLAAEAEEATRAAMVAANEQGQKGAEEEAKKVIDKLENEVLNGRKLIEDLQGDKRRDRQLLLELRAQLARPTHHHQHQAPPPHHMNPFRFGGTAPPHPHPHPPFIGGAPPPPPILPGPSAAAFRSSSAFSPMTGRNPAFRIENPPSPSPSDLTSHTAHPLPSSLPTSSRPTIYLPPPPRSDSSRQPVPF